LSFSTAFQADAFQNDAFQVVAQPAPRPRKKGRGARAGGGQQPIVPWTEEEQRMRREVFSGIAARLGAFMRDKNRPSAEMGLVMTETPDQGTIGAALLGAAIDDD
jgi:hypothetical protein